MLFRPALSSSAATSARVTKLSAQSAWTSTDALIRARSTRRGRWPALAACSSDLPTRGPWHAGPWSPEQTCLLPRGQSRGKKTRTTVRLEDLPQGMVLPAGALPGKDGITDHASSEGAGGSARKTRTAKTARNGRGSKAASTTSSDDTTLAEPAYPTVILQARNNMRQFANCILLTRVGGFYEMYFEHAQDYGPLLNLKVASKKTNAGPVPMAGFPFFQLDRFLKILVHDLNRYVAIAEEFPNSAPDKVRSGGLMHDRRVARIVTPGTLIDENFMDPYTNNYVMGIYVLADPPAEAADPEIDPSKAAHAGLVDDPATAVGVLGTAPRSSVASSAASPTGTDAADTIHKAAHGASCGSADVTDVTSWSARDTATLGSNAPPSALSASPSSAVSAASPVPAPESGHEPATSATSVVPESHEDPGTVSRPAPGTTTTPASPVPSLSAGVSAVASSPRPSSTSVGLAWLDLSTGHFYTQATTLHALGSVLSRVAPREIVLDENLQRLHGRTHPLFTVLDEDRQHQNQLLTFASSPPTSPSGPSTTATNTTIPAGDNPLGAAKLSEWAPVLESSIPEQTAQALSNHEVAAGSLLLHYVKNRLQGLSMKLQPPIRYEGMQVMTIDKNSMRSLEIKQTLRDGVFKGSLLHAIRRTVTKSGARLLNEWLSAPSTSLELIEARQNLVERFVQDEDLRDGITLLLRKSHDSHRLVQKFALGRGDPDDLLDLAKTICSTEDIVSLLQSVTMAGTKSGKKAAAGSSGNAIEDSLKAIAARIDLKRPLAIAERIRDSVDEEGLMQQHEMEENEAGAMMTLAQEVVQAEGSLEKDGSVLPKSKVTAAAAAAAASAATGVVSTPTRKKTPSLRDYYGEDSEAWVMKPSASKPLAGLHEQLEALTSDREALTEELRTRYDAPSLVLKWTPGLGHICHVRGKDAKRSAMAVARSAKSSESGKDQDGSPTAAPTTISSSRTTRSLHVPEWTSLGQKLDQVRFQIRAEEQRVFQSIRETVVRNLVPLRRNAAVLDELDIATSFACLANEQNLCRPRMNSGTSTVIVGGRHPTVEGGLAEQGRTFARNDLFVGDTDMQGGEHGQHGLLWLITGPNMGGKSTFLRQNALITILAQVGCYVPADYAELGIVDALFSRVGSADNLFRDQSTFMVEMLETAHILRQATPRSFVIMDEIGRGTTPEDGTAVAFAALHHLVHLNQCRTLFATHFHELADLAAADGMLTAPNSAVELYCTDVEEDEQGGFVYVHRLRRGINRHSHALKVARLAGLPTEAIQVAQQVLARREEKTRQQQQKQQQHDTERGRHDGSNKLLEAAA